MGNFYYPYFLYLKNLYKYNIYYANLYKILKQIKKQQNNSKNNKIQPFTFKKRNDIIITERT